MRPPRAILTDIEGTTTPIAYVRDVLFPYARARLGGLLAQAAERPDIAALAADVARLAPGRPVLDTLLHWMDADAKITPLKTLQGLIWREGYRVGDLQGDIYPDVAPALRRWHQTGLRLAVYSSGSVAAQRLLFAHSAAGDLSALFTGFYDTAIGPKREPGSYTGIAIANLMYAADWLFLSDIEAELDAARSAGFETCQLLRSADGTVASHRHAGAPDFANVERLWSAG